MGRAKVLWRGMDYDEEVVRSVFGSGYSHEEKKEGNGDRLGGEN